MINTTMVGRKLLCVCAAALSLVACTVAAAQEHGAHVEVVEDPQAHGQHLPAPHGADEPAAETVDVHLAPDPSAVDPAEHGGHVAAEGHDQHSDLIGLSHGRHASGTAWMPDSSAVYMDMWERERWQLMLHGAAHLTYIEMGGPRGDRGLYGPNWLMLRGTRPDGCKGQLELSGMFSLDPLTVGGAGYPLLFQSGETWNDEPLRDHQHPHNVFSELSLKYKWRLACDRAAYLYVAPVGEPALGPPAFMHRQIALDYPLSPIGHHWQDATHIAYGVVTAGVQSREWQVEGSVFNGREPGENRFAIDAPTFDSYSGRVSWNPGKNVSMQVSQGKLKEPEPTHPGEDVTRTSASLVYNHDLGCDRSWQTALVWGRNGTDEADFDSYLIESSLKQDGGWSPYFRYEWIEKNAEELVLPEPQFDHHDTFALQQAAVGLSIDLGDKGDWQWGLGGAYVFNFSPARLDPVYGADPAGWTVYLRAHPRRMQHDDHAEHGAGGPHIGPGAASESGQTDAHAGEHAVKIQSHEGPEVDLAPTTPDGTVDQSHHDFPPD